MQSNETAAIATKRSWHVERWVVALLGALLALLILDPSRVDPTNVDWLVGDLAQVQSAWEQFRQEPQWWTLRTTRMSYPVPIGIALFDTAPIVALLLRSISAVLPEPFQYIGLYFLVGLMLQGLFGALCVERLWDMVRPNQVRLRRTIIFCGGALFVLMPATIFRFSGHMALSSHWLIVASIWASLRLLVHSSPLNWTLCGGLLFFAAATNPYIAFLCSISPMLVCLLESGDRRLRMKRTAKMALMLGLIFVVASWAFGFLSGAVPDRGGYGFYSMNMLSPIDPGPFKSVLMKSLPTATPGQGEGYNYLGPGLLVLLLAAVIVSSILAVLGRLPQYPVIAVGALAIVLTYMLALSTKVTFGSSVVFELHLPNQLMNLLATLRASGRLFWLGAFWMIALGLYGALLLRSASLVLAIVVTALVLQVLDVRNVAQQVHNTIASYKVARLELPFANNQLEQVRYVHVIPPWQCNPDQTPGGAGSFEYLGRLATDHGWFQNSFYAGRVPAVQSKYHCSEIRLLPPDNSLLDKTLYVVSQAFYQPLLSKTEGHLACEKVRDFVVCLPRASLDK